MLLQQVFLSDDISRPRTERWQSFLQKNSFDFSTVAEIDLRSPVPLIRDVEGNRFSIDFIEDKVNYRKRKAGRNKELISRALGAGKLGLRVLDLSAGLGIDAVFLAQLGFDVTAVERNPLIFLCLEDAVNRAPDLKLKVVFAEAMNFLASADKEFDVIYFDPMFPEKRKSALPRQEMVFFKKLVGADADAADVVTAARRFGGVKRVAVKRPINAPELLPGATGSLAGKLIRYDLYGGM